MNSWKEIIICAQPKKLPQNRKELISCFLANITILFIVMSLGAARLILVKLTPYDFRQIPVIIELLIFMIMFCSIIRRSTKVSEWREKQIKPEKPAK